MNETKLFMILNYNIYGVLVSIAVFSYRNIDNILNFKCLKFVISHHLYGSNFIRNLPCSYFYIVKTLNKTMMDSIFSTIQSIK